MSDVFAVQADDVWLAVERWDGPEPTVVLLHAGVADRRSWREVAEMLAGRARILSYDRRGHGGSAPPSGPFSHLDDLVAVLDKAGAERAWLVGSSMGGGLAIDAAICVPDRVAGLVLIAPAVSGAPEPDLDAATRRLGNLYDEALAAGDTDEANRLETWIWLDGPGEPEGRVGDPARALALDMNRIVLENDVPEEAGETGIAAWDRLGEIDVPVTVVVGDLDASFLVTRSTELAGRFGQGSCQVVHGTAHLPYLERPADVATTIAEAAGLG